MKVYTIYETTLSYCLKSIKNTESKNPEVILTKNGKIKFLWKCAVCNSKKIEIIKEQEAKGLLSKFTGIKVPILSDLPIAIKFMREMHLR